MSAARWDRLVTDLAAAGTDVKVYAHAYPGGVSRSIDLRREDGSLIEIADGAWGKNLDVWTGWVVALFDREGILISQRSGLKKRSEVIRAVHDALSAEVVSA